MFFLKEVKAVLVIHTLNLQTQAVVKDHYPSSLTSYKALLLPTYQENSSVNQVLQLTASLFDLHAEEDGD